MWEHRCSATNVNGSQCARKSTMASWCHQFEDWSSGTDATHIGAGPSWWESCTQHSGHASRVVATIAVRS